MHVFISVGEPSGDQHAAELMQEFYKSQPKTRFTGFGGPEMQAAGLECIYQLTDLAVMGFAQVVPMIHKFHARYQQAKEFFAKDRPDAVLLIDFPGFNWWVARAAKQHNIPVYYYCPPQLWAWAPWRIRKVHRLIDCILSVLPFEAEWYRDHGVDVEYVGHPFFDEVAEHPIPVGQVKQLRRRDSKLIGLLPGSRKQEVLRNFPVMLDVMETLYEKHPNIHFQVACYKEWHHDQCAKLIAEHGTMFPVELHVDKTSGIIEAADFCLIVSGSVSLELLARKTPTAVIYRGSLLTYFLAHALITVDYFSLPNLIAGRPVMPEFPLVRRKSRHVDRLAELLDSWLCNPEQLQQVEKELSQLADEIVETGGVKRAAEVLQKRLYVEPQVVDSPISKAA